MTTEPILYSVTPFDLSGHRLKVVLTIPNPDPSGQDLFMPAWIPGSYLIRDFARQVETLQASTQGKPVGVRKTGNHTWACAPASGPLRIEYTVYAWDLSVRSAHIDESHAFFNGTSVFLEVVGQSQKPCLVELCPPPDVTNWRVYTSLREAQGVAGAARRHGFGLYQAANYDDLIDHPVEMGTPQVVSFQAHGAEHEMVFTGVIPGLDLERIAADAKKICEAQIAFFEPETCTPPFLDSADRYVFMTMVTGNAYGGLEHRASTALMASRGDLPVIGRADAGDAYQTFLGLVSHEYFHTWHVKRIKPQVFAPYDLARENHTELLWVFEGFTSYYDDLMLLRAGVIGDTDYLRLLGKTMASVRTTGGRLKQSVAESSFDAWTLYYKQDENSTNALVSYYTKGALVALGLDLLIREASGHSRSLDDVMRLLWSRFGKDFYRGHPIGIGEDAMPRLIEEATGVDVADFLARYAYGREDIPLDALLGASGIEVEWKSVSDMPSLDVRSRWANGEVQITSVLEGGAAHTAGISAGDAVVAIGGLRVTDNTSLERLLRSHRAGEIVDIHVFRRDELRTFQLTLASSPISECKLTRVD